MARWLHSEGATTLELRHYQARGLREASAAFAAGSKSVLLVSPTGSGKTTIGTYAARQHLAHTAEGRVVWFAHRRELISQAAETLRAAGLEVGTGAYGRHAPVQIFSVQKGVRSGEVPAGTFAVFDEAHHFADHNECGAIAAAYQRSLGLTATPQRSDHAPMSPPFDRLVVVAQVSELVALGHLSRLVVRCPRSKLQRGALAQSPVDAYLSEARGTQAVVFAGTVAAAKLICEQFAAANILADYVHGAPMRPERRDRGLDMFANRDIQVIVNCNILTEGWDCPGAETCITARGCKSPGFAIQMVGRVLRKYPGKEYGMWIDLGGAVHDPKIGRPDADREFSLTGEAIRLKPSAGARVCPICHLPLETPYCPDCRIDHTATMARIADEELIEHERLAHEAARSAAIAALKPNRLVLAMAGILAKSGGHLDEQGRVRFLSIFKRPPDVRTVMRASALNSAIQKYRDQSI